MPYMNRDNADYLVNKYADTILRISFMYLKQTQDAEDICQDVFIKLLAKDYQFDDQSAEKAWIIRTTINACKDHLRTSFWKARLFHEILQVINVVLYRIDMKYDRIIKNYCNHVFRML